MGVRNSACFLVVASLGLSGCFGVEMLSGEGSLVSVSDAAAVRRPTTKKKRRKIQRRQRRRVGRKNPAPPSAEPPPEDPPPPQCSGECGALEGITAAHNVVRAAVGVEPLVWNMALARHATAWANQLAANGCQLAHQSSNQYGENLYWNSSGGTAQSAVAAWTAEGANYDHEDNSCDGTCGHYTQVVWGASRNLGCGVASCGQHKVWVCEYDPRGNHVDQSPY